MAQTLHRQTFEWRQLRVAVLIVVGLALLAFALYRVGRVFDVFAPRYELVTLIPSAMGLREGAPVTLAGQRIGQVNRIEFVPLHQKIGENHLAVYLAIAQEVRDQIRADSRAFLRTQGLLGDRLVDIEPGTPGARILQPGDTLPAGRALDLDVFLARALGALDTANLIVADLRDITGGISRGEGTLGRLLQDDVLYDRMVSATGSLQATLEQINRADGTFGRLIRDPALYDQMNRTVARIDSLGTALLYGQGTLTRMLRSDSLYLSLLGSAAAADTAMAELQGFVQRITTGDGALQRLMTEPELYDQFLKAVVDLQTLIDAVRRDPSQIRPNIQIRVF